MTRAVVAFGSNLGDRLANIQAAVALLARKTLILRISAVYETAPMYVTDQPPFYNGAILLETDLGPLPLMRALKEIESAIGRQHAPRNGPREIDLDLLLYGDLCYRFRHERKTVLEVPHRRMGERLFVLQPLTDIDPDMMIPGLGSVTMLIASTEWNPEHVVEKQHAELSVPRI